MWQGVLTQITKVFAEYQLEHVIIERATEPPEQTSGGKYRVVISQN